MLDSLAGTYLPALGIALAYGTGRASARPSGLLQKRVLSGGRTQIRDIGDATPLGDIRDFADRNPLSEIRDLRTELRQPE
jgi:hypothetical protein